MKNQLLVILLPIFSTGFLFVKYFNSPQKYNHETPLTALLIMMEILCIINFGYTSLNVKSFEIFAFNTKLPDVSDMAIQRILQQLKSGV